MRNIIDRDIARLEEDIRALRSRRNELSPISRIPAEILCYIFSLLSRTRSPGSWSNFSQVSQCWRSSALSAPEIWTKIPLSYPRWVQEMLIRSKMAKLTIRSDLFLDGSDLWLRSETKAIETVRSCLYEMNRVEEINLTVFRQAILGKIFRDLPKSAPQLHTLCIGGVFSIHEDFLYNTERLQRVELNHCKISWDSRLLTGLTHLTLRDSLEANASIIQVLHALQRMPALTELYLGDSLPDDSGGTSTIPVVDLPYLRMLHISSCVGPLTTILRHITFPLSAILNLTCKEKTTQFHFSNFLSVLATKFLSSLVIRSLQVSLLDTDGYSLTFRPWTTTFIQDCFPSPSSLIPQSQLQLVLTWPKSRRQNQWKVLTSAFDAMRLSFLTQLQLSNLSCIDSQTWVKTFGQLPLLERVHLKSSAPNSLLEALVYKTKAAEESKTAYRSVSFPKLRNIHLEGTYFDAKNPRLTIISIEELLDYLMERCKRKAEIQVLRLENCYYISSDDVERLEEIVVDVIWDGVERAESDEEFQAEEDSEGDNYY